MTKPNVDLDPERVPVIVGVGQINDRPEDPEDGLDSLGLMAAALHVADDDAGVHLPYSPVGEGAQHFQRRALGVACFLGERQQGPLGQQQHRFEQFVLVLEMPVDRPPAEARLGGDVGQGGVGVAVAAEQHQRGIENLEPGLFGFFLGASHSGNQAPYRRWGFNKKG